MAYIGIVSVLICILLATAVSRRVQGTIITMPMVYTTLGILVGGMALNLVPVTIDDHVVKLVAELTLVFVLATDAYRIDLGGFIRDHKLPVRLLGIALPLTMIAGTAVAALIFTDLGIWEAAILGIVLTPTDAGLGQAVISSPVVPVRIRQALNIESGLNDGIAMPVLLLAIALALSTDRPLLSGKWLEWAISEIVLGVVAGVVVGFITIRFLQWGKRSGWMSSSFRKIAALALIILSFALANMIGGNGYIAAFCMGAIGGNQFRNAKDPMKEIFEFTEVEVQLLLMTTFILFGAVMLPLAVDRLSIPILVYAILSLTLVRMIPVGISMLGTQVSPQTSLFVGWFGPRGVASILYMFTVFETGMIANRDLIFDVAMITVLLSVFAHGITSTPLARRYGRFMATVEQNKPEAAEMTTVPEMPLRSGSQSTTNRNGNTHGERQYE